MSVLFLKRFLQRPRQVASIIPSSRILIRKVVGKMDFSKPRVIVEYGAGEGAHTRAIAGKMDAHSRLLLFELDAELAQHLRKQFKDDPRITVHHTDAARICEELANANLPHCDYVVSGIPFSFLPPEPKRLLLRRTYEALAPQDHSAFIIYQVSNELRDNGHCDHFPRVESEYCLLNIPPYHVTKFYRTANGHAVNGKNGHSLNGHSKNGHALVIK